jgi:hypothetical protein
MVTTYYVADVVLHGQGTEFWCKLFRFDWYSFNAFFTFLHMWHRWTLTVWEIRGSIKSSQSVPTDQNVLTWFKFGQCPLQNSPLVQRHTDRHCHRWNACWKCALALCNYPMFTKWRHLAYWVATFPAPYHSARIHVLPLVGDLRNQSGNFFIHLRTTHPMIKLHYFYYFKGTQMSERLINDKWMYMM